MDRLDLRRPRDLSELLGVALALERRWFSVFFTVTAIVAVPEYLLVDGIWGRQLADGPHAHEGAAIAAGLPLSFVVSAAVAALTVRIVERVADGHEPTVGEALSAAAVALPAALGATLLYFLGIVAGLLLLVLPGIWLSVRWSLAAQAAVAERLGARQALERSAELVRGRWWTVAGRLLAAAVLSSIAIELPIVIVGGAIDAPWLYVAITAILETIGRSFTGVFAALLYFSLRAEASRRAPAAVAGFEPSDVDRDGGGAG